MTYFIVKCIIFIVNVEKKKLICFDVDGTLTQYKTPLEAENRALLDKLSKIYKLVLVGAGSCKRIFEQTNAYPIDIIGNYGMEEAVVTNGRLNIIRQEKLSIDRAFFEEKTEYLRKKYGYTLIFPSAALTNTRR